MSTFNTVAQYKTAILAEISSIEDDTTRRIIQDLIIYAENTEAENRELRPRPDGTENAAFYRVNINLNNILSESLRNLIEELLTLVERLEIEIAEFKNQS